MDGNLHLLQEYISLLEEKGFYEKAMSLKSRHPEGCDLFPMILRTLSIIPCLCVRAPISSRSI